MRRGPTSGELSSCTVLGGSGYRVLETRVSASQPLEHGYKKPVRGGRGVVLTMNKRPGCPTSHQRTAPTTSTRDFKLQEKDVTSTPYTRGSP